MTIQKTAPPDVRPVTHHEPTAKVDASAPVTPTIEAKPATGVSALEPKVIAADPAWVAGHVAAHDAPHEAPHLSPLTVRLPEMSGKLTFNDNLTIALSKAKAGSAERSAAGLGDHEGKLTPAMAKALLDVVKQNGISPKEGLKDAERIAAHFTDRKDPNASILGELAAKIREAKADQGFLADVRARFSDIGKRDSLPSLTPAAVEATRPGGVRAWFDKHFESAKEAAPAEAPAKVGEGAATKPYVMCPVLGSLIDEGSLKQDDKGNISLKEFNDLMINRLGITPERAAVTVSTGFIGNHASDAGHILAGKFNINHLAGSILDHQGHGDTGILHGGAFHEDKFQALCAHSTDGKTLCIADFAHAINAQLARDDGFVTRAKGTSEDVFEMAALINTFGFIDDKGERRIDFATMRDLYQNRKLPPAEELRARKATGVAEHVDTMAKIGVEMTRGPRD